MPSTTPQEPLKVDTATGRSQRAAAEYVNAVRLIHNSGTGGVAASMVREAAEDALETVLEIAGGAALDTSPGLSGEDGVLTYIHEETQEAARHAGMTALEAVLTAAARIDASPGLYPAARKQAHIALACAAGHAMFHAAHVTVETVLNAAGSGIGAELARHDESVRDFNAALREAKNNSLSVLDIARSDALDFRNTAAGTLNIMTGNKDEAPAAE